MLVSPRTLNALKRGGVINLGLVFDMSDHELLEIRNFSEKSLAELKHQMVPLMYDDDEISPDSD